MTSVCVTFQDIDSPAPMGDERKLLITVDTENDQSQLSMGDGLEDLDGSSIA